MSIGQPIPGVMPRDRFPRAPGVLRLMLKPRTMGSALKVSMVVGTLLNVINNGNHLLMHSTANLWQAALNFVVPYGVSSYSAARNEARRERGA